MSETAVKNVGGRPLIKAVGENANGKAMALADAHVQSSGAVGELVAGHTSRMHSPPYNEEYAHQALDALESGMTLREHCRMQRKINPKYPDPQTFYEWAVDNMHGFGSRYAYSRRMLLQHWAEEVVEIAEDGRNDWMERRKMNGEVIPLVDHECVQRSKLRIDTRRWLLAKLLPHEYGDKIMHQQLGALGQPVDPPGGVQPVDLRIALSGWKPTD